MARNRYRQETLTASLKRALSGPTLKPIETDYTMKEVNSLLTDLLGKPGVSAGKAQNSITSPSTSASGPSAYTSAQMDIPSTPLQTGSASGGIDPITAAISGGTGLIRDLVGMAYNRKTDSIAYNRQNDFYNKHLSMSAKVEEYQEAGLNPMGLAGAGVGATSAPSVQGTGMESGSALVDVLGQLLNYKLKSRELDIQSRVADADIDLKKSSTSVNTATVDKIVAETNKIFSDTSKIDAETYILQLQGSYADDRFKTELANLMKDLDLKDVQIDKTNAEAANAWIIANYQDLQQLAEINLKKGQSFASYASGALDKYTKEFAESHDGALPYSGEVAAIIAGLGTLFGDGQGILGKVAEKGQEQIDYVSPDSTGTSEFRRDLNEIKKMLQGRPRHPYTTYGP